MRGPELPPNPNRFDPRTLRGLFGCFPTGVTIVTWPRGRWPARGMTADSFVWLSLDPPLVSWNVGKHSPSYDAFALAEVFAFSILSHEQTALSGRFSRAHADKFEGVELELVARHRRKRGPHRLPSICRRRGRDHAIVIGHVLDYQHHPKDPLVFKGGRYFALERVIEA